MDSVAAGLVGGTLIFVAVFFAAWMLYAGKRVKSEEDYVVSAEAAREEGRSNGWGKE